MTEIRRPDRCPACCDANFVRIVYGVPTPSSLAMVERGEAVLGGCFHGLRMPDWRCNSCRHEWLDLTDPARQEVENIIERAVQRRNPSVGK
jgi:hypothetical protein